MKISKKPRLKTTLQEMLTRVSMSNDKVYLAVAVIALIIAGGALARTYTNSGNLNAQASSITDLNDVVEQMGLDAENLSNELNDSIDEILQSIDGVEDEAEHLDVEIDQAIDTLNGYKSSIALIQEMALSSLDQGATLVAVQSSIDFIDSAGFHDMAENIVAGEISSRYLATVQNVLSVVESVDWPNSLLTEAAMFSSSLSDLADDLSENNEEAAINSSAWVHHTQHDLSHGVYLWLSNQEMPDWIYKVGNLGEALSNVRVQSAIDMIDNVGFHDMAESIAIGEISSRYLGRVQNTIYVLRSLPWPADLTEKVETFLTDLQGLEGALSTNDADLAVEASHAVHGSQHDLSHDVYHWLAHRESDSAVFEDGAVGEMIAIVSVQSAADFAAYLGTHSMAGSIAEGEVSPRYLGSVKNAIIVMSSTTFPEALHHSASEFNKALSELAEALEANDMDAMVETSDVAHGADHHFRDAAYEWLLLNAESLEHDGEDGPHVGESPEQIIVEASDWSFSMGHNEPVELTLTSGEAVEITLVNTGNMPHGIWSRELSINEGVRAGETVVISFTPLETGDFTFYCNDPTCGTSLQHSSMIGTITVTD
jgi:plastocyanin